VMGVSGSGKSYLAAKLAAATNWPFAEGDDYHSAANKAKMASGTPLTDEDRAPWLDILQALLLNWRLQGQSGILTCSALKESYRQHLTAHIPEARFVWLDPPRAILADRLAHRPSHFMSSTLLDSQLATLEPPADRQTLRLDGATPIEETISQVLNWLQH